MLGALKMSMNVSVYFTCGDNIQLKKAKRKFLDLSFENYFY